MAISYHEPAPELPPETRDLHRALTSLTEELEAIDWYQQRAAATADSSLQAVLLHNRNEEIEHATMLLEWLRRRIPKLDEMLRVYLFTDQPITAIEAGATGDSHSPADGQGPSDLGIGTWDRQA